jgi:hypothetical protein
MLPKLGKNIMQKTMTLQKTGKKGIELKEAKKQGYEACKICKVEQTQKVDDKPKDKKTTHKTK